MLIGSDGDRQQILRALSADAASVDRANVDAGVVSLDDNGIAEIDAGEFPQVAGNADTSLGVNVPGGFGFHLLSSFCFIDVALLLFCCVSTVIIPE
jgi:hypothetical protein